MVARRRVDGLVEVDMVVRGWVGAFIQMWGLEWVCGVAWWAEIIYVCRAVEIHSCCVLRS